MWSAIFILIVAGWVIISTYLDGSQRTKNEILKDMKDYYSKDEALNLLYSAKHQTLILYLAYGFVLGVLITLMYKD